MDWQQILRKRTIPGHEIRRRSGLSEAEWQEITARFPARVLDSATSAQEDAERVWQLQFYPSRFELRPEGVADPLQEEIHRKAKCLIHRYPNRALFLVSNRCASYCRYCTRRRTVGKDPNPSQTELEEGLRYITAHPEITEVILSGGDPLMLNDSKLMWLLGALRNIPHIDIIRLSTRMLTLLPERFTDELISLLAEHQPLYLITQINHAIEFTTAADQTIRKAADRGIPLLNQSVLLRGVNDDPRVMLELVTELVKRRIRPYYLHQLDPVTGACHFAVPVEKGRAIIRYLRENIGGFAVPHYVSDDPNRPAKTLLYSEQPTVK